MANEILTRFTIMYHWKLWNVIVFNGATGALFESLDSRFIINYLTRYSCYYAALDPDSERNPGALDPIFFAYTLESSPNMVTAYTVMKTFKKWTGLFTGGIDTDWAFRSSAGNRVV